ncbi:hypothetical protein P7K49_026085 [Saguinus oedipus]|uniref:Uncharacterized protein n=1 Tax=Saguinus oedipus TaxID=9490 RepID=A0ABQ9UJ34_SAGOE|nr:hypothetical protein P7K49_026085 [Saguinus oedipus]
MDVLRLEPTELAEQSLLKISLINPSPHCTPIPVRALLMRLRGGGSLQKTERQMSAFLGAELPGSRAPAFRRGCPGHPQQVQVGHCGPRPSRCLGGWGQWCPQARSAAEMKKPTGTWADGLCPQRRLGVLFSRVLGPAWQVSEEGRVR